MGKVYSKELRDQDEELKKFGVVSEKTRRRATSAWVPDFSSYDFGEEFLRWEGIEFKDVQRLQSLWRQLGSDLTLTRKAYEFFMNESGLSKRQSKDVASLTSFSSSTLSSSHDGSELSDVARAPVLSQSEATKLEVLRQYESFLSRQRDFGQTQQKRRVENHANLAGAPRVAALDVLAGVALVSKANSAQKAGYLFGLFDFNRKKKLERDEVLAMLSAAMRGYCAIKSAPLPPPEGLEWLVDVSIFEHNRIDPGSGTISMGTFVDWCKRNPNAEVILANADAVATGSGSAFADRRRAMQKKLLTRLARIESSLEMLGEAPFPPEEIQDLISNTLQAREENQRLEFLMKNKTLKTHDHDEPQLDSNQQNFSSVEEVTYSENQDRQAETLASRNRRTTTIAGTCVLHRWFSELVPVEEPKVVQDPNFAGLTINQYSTMSEADRTEWSESTQMMRFLTKKLDTAWPFGKLRLPACTSPWLYIIALNAGADIMVAEPRLFIQAASSNVTDPGDQTHEDTLESAKLLKQESLPTPAMPDDATKEEVPKGSINPETQENLDEGASDGALDESKKEPAIFGEKNVESESMPCLFSPPRNIPISLLMQWVRTWPLAVGVKSRSATGKYWAWARVLVPLCRALVFATTKIVPSLLADFLRTTAKHLWIGDRYDQQAETHLGLSIAFDPDDTFAAQATLEYKRRGEPARRLEESTEPPEIDEDIASEELLDLFDYELSTISQSLLLKKGHQLYTNIFHEPPASNRGSLAKLNVSNPNAYAIIDFDTHVSAIPAEISMAAFKLRMLFTHEYFQASTVLVGAHILEIAEFKGSAKKIRIALFFNSPSMEEIMGHLEMCFGKAEHVAIEASIGSDVDDVLNAPWNGHAEDLWDMNPSPDADRPPQGRIGLAQQTLGSSHSPLASVPIGGKESLITHTSRRQAMDLQWAMKLGLGLPSAPRPRGKPSQGGDESDDLTDDEEEEEDDNRHFKPDFSQREKDREARLRISEKQLTELGHACVASMMQEYDQNGDGALDVREMNEFQKALGAEIFASEQEYHAALQEDGAIVNRQGNLTLEGLEDLYIRGDPQLLARDIGHLGLYHSSLARIPFQGSIHLHAPMYGRVCDDFCAEEFGGSLQHFQDLFVHGFEFFTGTKDLWRQHSERSRLEVSYASWRDAFEALKSHMELSLPVSLMTFIQQLVFEAGFLRNFAHDWLSVCRGLVYCLKRAQINCLDDEVEDEDERDPLSDSVQDQFQAMPSTSIDNEDQSCSEPRTSFDEPGLANFIERKLLKTVYHMCNALRNTVAGVSSAEIRFRDDRTILLHGNGLNLVDWILDEVDGEEATMEDQLQD